jgi:hypothetical protein
MIIRKDIDKIHHRRGNACKLYYNIIRYLCLLLTYYHLFDLNKLIADAKNNPFFELKNNLNKKKIVIIIEINILKVK